MMKKLIVSGLLMLGVMSTSVCFAETGLHKIEDEIGIDKFAHFGAGYFIADQLKRNTKMTPLERWCTVAAIAYAKERLVDDTIDKRDIAATVLGGTMYEVHF